MTDTNKKPPLGLIPRRFAEQQRRNGILEAMQRYNAAHKSIPSEWLDELYDLNWRLESEGPVVTPAADDRGPGSVAPDDSPVATDEELCGVWNDAGSGSGDDSAGRAMRALYNLGREHGANSKPTPSPSQIRSSSPEPAAAPDRPLWVEMRDVYSDPSRIHWSGHGFARELRVVADWLERHEPYSMDAVLALRAEAARAEMSR